MATELLLLTSTMRTKKEAHILRGVPCALSRAFSGVPMRLLFAQWAQELDVIREWIQGAFVTPGCSFLSDRCVVGIYLTSPDEVVKDFAAQFLTLLASEAEAELARTEAES